MNRGDALEFLRVAKFALRDNPYRYEELLHLLTDMMNGRIGARGIADAVQRMFQDDRPEIIFFLNAFMPEAHKIPLSSALVDGAKDLILKVKERSRGGSEGEAGDLYASFIHILGLYSRGMKQHDEARREILALFQDHQDLQHDFDTFFPSATAPTDGGGQGTTTATPTDNGQQLSATVRADSGGEGDDGVHLLGLAA